MKAANIEYQVIGQEQLIGRVAAQEITRKDGSVIVDLNTEIDAAQVEEIMAAKVGSISTLFIDGINADDSFRNTLLTDKVESREEALLEIYRRLRPGDPPAVDSAEALFENLFFNPDRYDLSAVGRLKLNERVGVNEPIDQRV